jgi:hypothetical protein
MVGSDGYLLSHTSSHQTCVHDLVTHRLAPSHHHSPSLSTIDIACRNHPRPAHQLPYRSLHPSTSYPARQSNVQDHSLAVRHVARGNSSATVNNLSVISVQNDHDTMPANTWHHHPATSRRRICGAGSEILKAWW